MILTTTPHSGIYRFADDAGREALLDTREDHLHCGAVVVLDYERGLLPSPVTAYITGTAPSVVPGAGSVTYRSAQAVPHLSHKAAAVLVAACRKLHRGKLRGDRRTHRVPLPSEADARAYLASGEDGWTPLAL